MSRGICCLIINHKWRPKCNKLHNTGSDGSWDYINGITYFNNAISFIQTEEGRAIPSNGYTYQYNLQDQLGNNRVTFYKNPVSGNTEIVQENEYYSFGLSKTLVQNGNKYLYNGKEIQTDLTNQYDYGARFYDPVIARWTSVDPLAEKYPTLSHYSYVGNSPLNLVDPDGRDWDYQVIKNKKGEITGLELKITGKILDRTGDFNSRQLINLKNDYVSGIETQLKGKIGSLNLSVSANITVANSLSEVSNTDHLINIVNDSAIPGDDGKSIDHGLDIWMSKSSVDNTLKNGDANAFLHELGHTGGLKHPNEENDDHFKTNFPINDITSNQNYRNFMWGAQKQKDFYYGKTLGLSNVPYTKNDTYIDVHQIGSIGMRAVMRTLNRQYENGARPSSPQKN